MGLLGFHHFREPPNRSVELEAPLSATNGVLNAPHRGDRNASAFVGTSAAWRRGKVGPQSHYRYM